MVGLYQNRRANRSSSSKLLRFFMRFLFVLGIFLLICFTITALFFNGSQVKGPLSIYLSSKFDMDVSIGDAEFSPIYPYVIKLYKVQFGNSNIGELYLEYNIKSALGNDELKIKDLYLNKIDIDPDDLLSLAKSKLGFNSIKAQKVRFYGTPLRTPFLNAPSATVRLENVTYNSQDGLTFRSGAMSTAEARLFGDEVKSFNIEFTHNDDNGIAINNFSTGILGGTVTGHGTYNILSQNHNSQDIENAHNKGVKAEIVLDELNLSKVIINQGLRAPDNVKLSVIKTNLNDVIFTNDALHATSKETLETNQSNVFKANVRNENSNSHKDLNKEGSTQERYLSYIMQGINGTIDDLYIDHTNIEGMFDGHIDEISFPNLQTTFENNNAIASFESNKLEFDLKGNLYEGNFNSIGSLDLNKKRLSITDLRMNKNKLAINPPRLKFIKEQFSDHSLFIKNAKFNQLEFLSFINSLPLSIQSISGTANNIFVHHTNIKDLENALNKDESLGHKHNNNNEYDGFYKLLSYITLDDGAVAASKEESLNLSKNKLLINPDIYSDNQDTRNVMKEKSPSSLKLNLVNMLYSNLLMSDTNVNLTLDEQGLAIDIPKMRFKESTLSAQGYLSLKTKLPSKLTIKTPDFETADLNSNLINHMLTGKVNFDLNIESQCDTKINNFKTLINHSNGHINLDSSAMLIADFGLDLINGGNNDNYKLSSSELLSAIQGNVAGINNLKLTTKVHNGQFDLSSTASLVTSNISVDSKIDFNNNDISGRAYLVSLSKDSSTQVTLEGPLNDPKFNIKALRRGERRPGLYLPQYQTSAVAKEQTDAAAVLKGKIEIAKPSANQKIDLKEQVLEQKTSESVTVNNKEAQNQLDKAQDATNDNVQESDKSDPNTNNDSQENVAKAQDATKGNVQESDKSDPKTNNDSQENVAKAQDATKGNVQESDKSDPKANNYSQENVAKAQEATKGMEPESLDSNKATNSNNNKSSSDEPTSLLPKTNQNYDKAQSSKEIDDAQHAQDMIDEEHQALNRQKQMEDQANATEMELLKDALIDSIISKPQASDEEEMIF